MPIDLSKLPEFCALKHPVTGETVLVTRGVQGFTPAPHIADPEIWNQQQGITGAQFKAMEAGSLFGFHVPLADPDNWASRLN